LSHGANILILGPTNAGKSSLFNLLLQEDKMIVSPLKGTTTDQSEQPLNIQGKKATIIDSAGLRDSKSKIEKIGVDKTYKAFEKNDKIIVVLSPDSLETKDFYKVEKVFKNLKSKKTVVVFNKMDLKSSKIKFEEWKERIPNIKKINSITISCKESVNNPKILKKLHKFIDKNLLSVDTHNDDYYFSEVRHIKCLKSVSNNLDQACKNISDYEISAKYLRDAMDDLDELYGKHNDEEKFGIIFNNFCVGK
tara:strand:- start:38 stop:787 length:750 start_codon:yes stop_codon:yes gene_type:complete